MPIEFIDLGVHKTVYAAKFGDANIYISTADHPSGYKMLMLHNIESNKMEEEMEASIGKNTDEMPPPDFVFMFNEPASISVLQSALNFIQIQMFKERGML